MVGGDPQGNLPPQEQLGEEVTGQEGLDVIVGSVREALKLGLLEGSQSELRAHGIII